MTLSCLTQPGISNQNKIIITSIYEISCPDLKSSIAGTPPYCIFTAFLPSHNLLICVHDSLNHRGIDMVQKYSKDSTSLFLPTFLSVCLIYLKRLYPRHQSFPRFRDSFDFKEPWVVRSGLKYMKGEREKKKKKFCSLVNAALCSTEGTEHSASKCGIQPLFTARGKEHSGQIEYPEYICPSRIPGSLSCEIVVPQDIVSSRN